MFLLVFTKLLIVVLPIVSSRQILIYNDLQFLVALTIRTMPQNRFILTFFVFFSHKLLFIEEPVNFGLKLGILKF